MKILLNLTGILLVLAISVSDFLEEEKHIRQNAGQGGDLPQFLIAVILVKVPAGYVALVSRIIQLR